MILNLSSAYFSITFLTFALKVFPLDLERFYLRRRLDLFFLLNLTLLDIFFIFFNLLL